MTPSNQDIPQKIQELQSAQSQIRFWRTLTIVAVILIVVTCVALISTGIQQLASPGPRQDAFLEDLAEGINRDVVPELQRMGTQAASDVAPIVQAELQNLNHMAPEFAASLQRELHNLTINVSGESEKILDDHFRGMIESRRLWIEKNFADVSQEKVDIMIENLNTIAEERIRAFTDEMFAQQIIALNRITENMQSIQQAEMANVSHDVPTWEMGLLFFDIVRDELSQMESLNGSTHLLDKDDLDQIQEQEEELEEQ